MTVKRTGFQASVVCRAGLAIVTVLCLGAGRAGAELTPAQIERWIVGTWELAEWHSQGQVLKPPAVGGRWQVHDGQMMSIFNRDTNDAATDVFSYGTYSTTQAGWSYGWDRQLVVTRKASETVARQRTTPHTLFTPRLEGEALILEYKGGERRFVFRTDEFIYLEKDQVQRKWRRVRSARDGT